MKIAEKRLNLSEIKIETLPTILVVEDDEGLNHLMQKTLQREGFRTEGALNGADGIERVVNNRNTVLLLDYILPDMDGKKVIETLTSKNCDVPFIIITGRGSEYLAVEMMKLGARDYIVKDAGLTDILPHIIKRVINDITREKELADANEALLKSERRFRDISESAMEWIWEVDKNGKYTYASPVVERLLGYKPEEVLEKHFYDLFHPEDREELKRSAFKVFSEKQPFRGFINRNIHKNGNAIWLLTSGTPVFDEKGNLFGYRGVDIDITERRQAEAFIKNILESMGEGFIVLDKEYRILTANKAFCQQVKIPVEDIIGRQCFKVSHHINMPCYEVHEDCPTKKAFETGKSHIATHTHYDRNGNPIYIEIKSYPIKDESGRIASVIEILNNVTEKKSLESQLMRLHKMEALDQFARGVAHDFNNILTALTGYGNLLKMKIKKDNSSSHNVDQILTLTERATSLTQNLFAFSRDQIVSPRPVNLNEIIRGAEKLLLRLVGKDIELKLMDTDKNLTIMADNGQIEQVLINLATNVKDAMPAGGLLTIETELVGMDRDYIKTFGYGKPGLYALVSVTDTGTGMDEETKGKIFDLFFTTKETGKGIGLGLSIVYEIIKRHNGYINVFSEQGKGTTFKIYLPVIKPEVEETKPVHSTSEMGGTETILVAEDEVEVRKNIKTVLEEFGYKVIEAVDGKEAVEKFRENKDSIQLILLDVVMPRKNGKEAYVEISNIRPDVKVLLISGYTSDSLHKKGIFENGLTLLPKPVSPQELLRKIREVLVT